MGRIQCPACGRSNRARRQTCGVCGEPIAHLRGPKGPARTPPTRQWPPNGSRVSVIRSRHGWHDGRVSGVLVAPGRVCDDEGVEWEIPKPADVHIRRS